MECNFIALCGLGQIPFHCSSMGCGHVHIPDASRITAITQNSSSGGLGSWNIMIFITDVVLLALILPGTPPT